MSSTVSPLMSRLSCALPWPPRPAARRGAALAALAVLSGCGGGADSPTTAVGLAPLTPVAATAGTSPGETFPTGLVVAAPTALPDAAAVLDTVLEGDRQAALASALDLEGLFRTAGHAGCHGPALLYANHEDAGGADAGLLAAGDVGWWQATDTATGQPCVVAQLDARTDALRQQTRQALLLLAAVRAGIPVTPTPDAPTLPPAAGRTDLTTVAAAALATQPAFAGWQLQTATLALDPFGKTYTYRLVLAQGTGSGARSGEIVLQHRPGTAASDYSGLLRLAGFTVGTDAALGCSDRMTSGRHQLARVSTVRYRREGAWIDFGARAGVYCGAPADLADADHAGQVARFTADGELDPAAVTGLSAQGWRGDFERVAARLERTAGSGEILVAWQPRPDDGMARALALTSRHDSVLDRRTLQGHFAHADALTTGDGTLRGLVCHWSGPGALRQPVARFQSQTAERAAGATRYTATTSRIAYAPTNTCASTTTVFDADGDGTLQAGEGAGLQPALDAPSAAGVSVQAELLARGYRQPEFY